MSNASEMQLQFTPLGSKVVEADFSGGAITSDAGVLLLRETDRQIGLIDALTEAILDSRDQRYVKHELRTLLTQRINQIACGYEDADDCDVLREDPAFKMAAGRCPETDRDLASQPTISRLENQVTRKDLYRIGQTFVDQFIASYAEPPSIIVLDFDTTDDPTHGAQQLTLFHGYYDEHCYLPLHVYEGLSGKFITAVLRPGRTLSAQDTLTVLKRLLPPLRQAWGNETMIVFRGDSHLAKLEVMDYLEDNGIFYVLGLATNPVLSRLGEPVIERARELYDYCQRKVRCFDDFFYRAKSWCAPRRVIVKAEITEKGENPRYVVTNICEADPQAVYDEIYSPRGQMENFIKGHKLHLRSDRTSCHRFEANQFRLFLHSAAYVLLHTMQHNLFRGTEWAKAQFDRLQLRVLKIGARVRELKTKIRVQLPHSYPLKELLQKACGIVAQLRAPPEARVSRLVITVSR